MPQQIDHHSAQKGNQRCASLMGVAMGILIQLCITNPVLPVGWADRTEALPLTAPQPNSPYSHSIVPGGLLVMSSTTRLTPFTSLTMRFDICSSTS
jgi:hypothetical protein